MLAMFGTSVGSVFLSALVFGTFGVGYLLSSLYDR
jgi:hypothetical protein